MWQNAFALAARASETRDPTGGAHGATPDTTAGFRGGKAVGMGPWGEGCEANARGKQKERKRTEQKGEGKRRESRREERKKGREE